MKRDPQCGCSTAGPCKYAAILFRHKHWRTRLPIHLEYAMSPEYVRDLFKPIGRVLRVLKPGERQF